MFFTEFRALFKNWLKSRDTPPEQLNQQKLDDKVEKEMNKFLEKFTKSYVSAHKKAA